MVPCFVQQKAPKRWLRSFLLHETGHQLRQNPLDRGGALPAPPKISIKEEHMELMKKRLANLLSVKSLVTLVLTVVFAYLAVEEKIARDFMTVYTVVIAFYFGTQQSRKGQDALDAGKGEHGEEAHRPCRAGAHRAV